MKQTAVEWFANELYEKFEMRGDGNLFVEIIEQAIEMFKQQIVDAYDDGNYAYGMGIKEPEQYYNETFKTK